MIKTKIQKFIRTINIFFYKKRLPDQIIIYFHETDRLEVNAIKDIILFFRNINYDFVSVSTISKNLSFNLLNDFKSEPKKKYPRTLEYVSFINRWMFLSSSDENVELPKQVLTKDKSSTQLNNWETLLSLTTYENFSCLSLFSYSVIVSFKDRVSACLFIGWYEFILNNDDIISTLNSILENFTTKWCKLYLLIQVSTKYYINFIEFQIIILKSRI